MIYLLLLFYGLFAFFAIRTDFILASCFKVMPEKYKPAIMFIGWILCVFLFNPTLASVLLVAEL